MQLKMEFTKFASLFAITIIILVTRNVKFVSSDNGISETTEPVTQQPDYGDSSEYDDADVDFDPSPPNVLVLVNDPRDNSSSVPLANLPNTEVMLDRTLTKVHLFCSAYYPIVWNYLGDGVKCVFVVKLQPIISQKEMTAALGLLHATYYTGDSPVSYAGRQFRD